MSKKSNPPSPPGAESIDLETLLPPFAPTDVATQWLFRLQRLGIRPGLQAIDELLDHLGRPERRFPCIVVAGTNGKGSAALALDALCRSAGLRTGLYTSPHLLDVRERITVDGTAVSMRELTALVSAQRGAIEKVRTTFFESLTALALLHFARERVDVAVLEAGLGGRLDATNAVPKAGVVLTSVGLDHQELLGETHEAIALEKLGLAAPGVPFYVDALDEPGLDDLARRTIADAGALHRHLPTLTASTTTADEVLATATEGAIQRLQVRQMLAVFRDLAPRFGWADPDVERALQGLRFPGRYEVWGRAPRLIVDTAHNAPALERVGAQFAAEGERARRILVFGSVHGKTIAPALPGLVRSAATVLVTAPHWYRARRPEDVAAELRAVAEREGVEVRIDRPGSVRETLECARRLARAGGVDDARVLVTGSNFLVAEALDRLGVDDLLAEHRAPLWDADRPLRRRGRIPAGAVAP